MSIDFASVLAIMVENKASDVHLSPGVPPAMRLRGQITPMENFERLTQQDTREIVYSVLNDAQRKRFENERQLDLAYSIPGLARFRVNVFFQRGAISAAFRLIPSEILDLRTLGLPAVMSEFTRKPRGFVLVTGPTGSGKSTTLASMIDMINNERQDHILTIEDPIEFVHRHKNCIVNQREVGADATDFASALRGALREDPDVILVGEMRDLETISTALTAAETGHLVFATLHTQRRAADGRPHHRRLPAAPAARRCASSSRTRSRAWSRQQLIPTADGQGRACATEILIADPRRPQPDPRGQDPPDPLGAPDVGAVGMQTMDSNLAGLVREGKITRAIAEQRAAVPEELRRLLGTVGTPGNGAGTASMPAAMS